jgi:hypothetical protein
MSNIVVRTGAARAVYACNIAMWLLLYQTTRLRPRDTDSLGPHTKIVIPSVAEPVHFCAAPQHGLFPVPGKMSALVMDVHLGGLVVVELLPDVGLVLGGEPGPGLVSPSVILVTRSHLDVVVEFDNLNKEKK